MLKQKEVGGSRKGRGRKIERRQRGERAGEEEE